MTITERLEKQRIFKMRLYAEKIVRDKSGLRMKVFEHQAGIYGREWAEQIWLYCREIKNEINN